VKFLLDHDVPEDLRYLLEQLGHDVNASDEAVLQYRQIKRDAGVLPLGLAFSNGGVDQYCNRPYVVA
jgi:hypothetical protein